MRRLALPVVWILLAAFVVTGCYNAVIETGRPRSGRVIEKPWAHGFLYGSVTAYRRGQPDVWLEAALRASEAFYVGIESPR